MKYNTSLKNHHFKLTNKKIEIDFTNDNVLFGYACAAAQIENGLEDIWLKHAISGKVAGFLEDDPLNIRNNFWDEPDGELQYVYDTEVQVFRMGLDWQRICPNGSTFSYEAIEKYKAILLKVKSKGIKTMVTLYHHSEPMWTHKEGSWSNSWMIDKFCDYTQFVCKELYDIVDYWNTFNEVQMYITLTQLSDFWPNPNPPRALGLFNIGPFKGTYDKALNNVAQAHIRSYKIIKSFSDAPISVAHNLAYYIGEDFLGRLSAKISWKKFNFLFIDLIKTHLDFLGINYYGAEVLQGSKLVLSEHFEYSDSGRAIYPKGLYEMLMIFYKRYKLPIFITENGMSDSKDIIREKYMTEHLKALKQAINDGVPIMGYIWWSMTDNLEWADGYAPKFGLVEVKRDGNQIIRNKRKSYELYKTIVQEKKLSNDKVKKIDKSFHSHIGSERTMTRAEDAQTALSEFRYQKVKDIDWSVD